jgi:hypothetical protein
MYFGDAILKYVFPNKFGIYQLDGTTLIDLDAAIAAEKVLFDDQNGLFFDMSNLDGTNRKLENMEQAIETFGEYLNIWHNVNSAVRLFNGIITNNGNGTVSISAGGGMFKTWSESQAGINIGECEPIQLNTGQAGKLNYAEWSLVSSLELEDNAYNYIYATWNHSIQNPNGTYGAVEIIADTDFYLQA